MFWIILTGEGKASVVPFFIKTTDVGGNDIDPKNHLRWLDMDETEVFRWKQSSKNWQFVQNWQLLMGANKLLRVACIAERTSGCRQKKIKAKLRAFRKFKNEATTVKMCLYSTALNSDTSCAIDGNTNRTEIKLFNITFWETMTDNPKRTEK